MIHSLWFLKTLDVRMAGPRKPTCKRRRQFWRWKQTTTHYYKMLTTRIQNLLENAKIDIVAYLAYLKAIFWLAENSIAQFFNSKSRNLENGAKPSVPRIRTRCFDDVISKVPLVLDVPHFDAMQQHRQESGHLHLERLRDIFNSFSANDHNRAIEQVLF